MNLCINCKHFDEGESGLAKLGVCHRFPRKAKQPKQDPDFLVTGVKKPIEYMKSHEIYNFAGTMRLELSECGTEGKFYEPKNGIPAETIKSDPPKKPKFWKRMFNLE